eukprot:3527250-Pyramimonas_sp.AAC.1
MAKAMGPARRDPDVALSQVDDGRRDRSRLPPRRRGGEDGPLISSSFAGTPASTSHDGAQDSGIAGVPGIVQGPRQKRA